jgi:hypothetical protein
LPHVPQFNRSVLVSVHVPPQRVVVPVQMQLLALQIVPPVHVCAHAPQFFGSLLSSTHDPLQFVLPVPHDVVHADVSHTSLVAQDFPHDPQLSWLLVVSTQSPAQRSRPGPHLQMLEMHVVPPAHVLPHVPQLLGSVAVSTHVPPQMERPVGHVSPPPSSEVIESVCVSPSVAVSPPSCASTPESLWTSVEPSPAAVSSPLSPKESSSDRSSRPRTALHPAAHAAATMEAKTARRIRTLLAPRCRCRRARRRSRAPRSARSTSLCPSAQ